MLLAATDWVLDSDTLGPTAFCAEECLRPASNFHGLQYSGRGQNSGSVRRFTRDASTATRADTRPCGEVYILHVSTEMDCGSGRAAAVT